MITDLLKRILPDAAKAALRNAVQRRGLSMSPKRTFDGSRLRRQSEVSLAAMFADPEIAARFGEDHRTISTVLGTHSEIIAGVNPGDRRALYHIVGALRPQSVLEIGTHTGTSLIYIASALRAFSPPGARITSTDILDVNGPSAPWHKLGLPLSPAGSCNALGLDPVVTFATATAAQKLAEQNSYDLIFLDGDHSPVAVYNEIASSLQRLSPDGLILLHDYYPGGTPIRGPWAGVARMVEEVPDIVVLPLGELPWPTKKDSHLTSLALVMRR